MVTEASNISSSSKEKSSNDNEYKFSSSAPGTQYACTYEIKMIGTVLIFNMNLT